MTRLMAERNRITLLPALTLAACALVTEPTDEARVKLLVQGVGSTGIVAPTAGVEDGAIVVRGTLSTPCLGYGVTADAKQTKAALVLTVRGRQQGEICLTAIGNFAYGATVYDAMPGARRVIVQHVIEDANWPATTVLDTTVTVR